jgi:hypothetical protein
LLPLSLAPAPRSMRGSGGAMRIREWGEVKLLAFALEQVWLRLPRALYKEAGLSPEAIAASTLGGNGLRRGRLSATAGWANIRY